MQNQIDAGKQQQLRLTPASRGMNLAESAPLHPVLQLQQEAGNQAVQALLRSGMIQAKSAISNSDDPEEREADKVAHTIMRSPAGFPASHCSCAGSGEMCEECQQQAQGGIHRHASRSEAPAHVPQIVRRVLGSSGQPLDAATRAFFEPRFSRDFSDVRIHADTEAAASACAIDANAYTADHDIAFADGQYAPETSAGRELLAHELTHVVQQAGEEGIHSTQDVERPAPSFPAAALHSGGLQSGEHENGLLSVKSSPTSPPRIARSEERRAASGKDAAPTLLQRQPAGHAPPTTVNPPSATLPTRPQLNAEVDRMFREFFPDAPKRLDPTDSKQADLVDTWLGVRDGILDQWTDRVFFSFFPNAPRKLDPSKSDDAQLIEFWGDIRHQIRDGVLGRYHWGPQAVTSAPQRPRTPGPMATPAPPLRVRDILHFGAGRFALDFETDPSVEAATVLVFPQGAPRGVTVSLYGPRQILFEHITTDSLRSMPNWLANAFSQAGQGYDDDPKQHATKLQPAGAHHGKPHPEIDIDTPEGLKKWIELYLHAVHVVGDAAELAEFFAKAAENIAYKRAVAEVGVEAAEGVGWGGAGVGEVMQFHRAAAIAEVLEVVGVALRIVGDVALIIWVGYQVIEAFKSEKEGEKQFGYLYGVMWEALGEPDHVRVYKNPGITYSADELREAFVKGVAEGREKGKEAEIRNAINVWVGMVSARTGLGVWAAAHEVITEMYNKSQRFKARNQLEWSTPFPYTGIVGMLSGEQ